MSKEYKGCMYLATLEGTIENSRKVNKVLRQEYAKVETKMERYEKTLEKIRDEGFMRGGIFCKREAEEALDWEETHAD